MNQDILKGQWNQLKGRLRRRWGKLTDNDLTHIKGDRDILLGKLQERYGQTRDELVRELDLWLDQLDEEEAEAPRHTGRQP
jgi:uncharacterized protein YjbJ (UPF0337 family)